MFLPELITQTENFIEENETMGFNTEEEFVRDAIPSAWAGLNGITSSSIYRMNGMRNLKMR